MERIPKRGDRSHHRIEGQGSGSKDKKKTGNRSRNGNLSDIKEMLAPPCPHSSDYRFGLWKVKSHIAGKGSEGNK
jgi:hypothetical protein